MVELLKKIIPENRIKARYIDLVSLLLDKKVDINVRDDSGKAELKLQMRHFG